MIWLTGPSVYGLWRGAGCGFFEKRSRVRISGAVLRHDLHLDVCLVPQWNIPGIPGLGECNFPLD